MRLNKQKLMLVNFIINFLYTLLFLPLATIRIFIKAIKNPKYFDRLSERFVFSPLFLSTNKSYNFDIWIHTVSVGEFVAAKPLILELIKRKPDYKILLTCTTLTGTELVKKFIDEQNALNKLSRLKHVYFPYDSNIICSRFIKHYNPKMAVFFETEIWPKMFKQIKKQNIKLFIINARLSEKSYKGYARFKSYIKKIINHADFIATQGKLDQERFEKLGYDKTKISTYGNIKYNIKLPTDIDQVSSKYRVLLDLNAQSLVLVAASTHQGEEEIVLNAFIKLKKTYPNLLLILVPRHPERFKGVEKLCLATQMTVRKYSDGDNTTVGKNIDIFLLDTIGQLLYFYNLADMAFIGGSMVPVGGHNPLEAAVFKKPVIMGPHYHNFTEIVENLKKHHGLLLCESAADLDSKILPLLLDRSLRAKIGLNAFAALTEQGNILEKYTELLLNCD